MASHIIDGDINKEQFQELLNAFNSGNIDTVYIKSAGGEIAYEEAIIDLLNLHKPKLIGIEIQSCAFSIFFHAVKCDRSFMDQCMGMYHQMAITYQVNEYGRAKYRIDAFQREKYWKIVKQRSKKLISQIFDSKMIKKYNRDVDLYFDSNELRKMIEKQNGLSIPS